MEGSSGALASAPSQAQSFAISNSAYRSKYEADSLVLQATFASGNESENDLDSVSVSFNHITGGLSITAQDVIKKLNEILKGSLPEGLESLNPEDHTAEKTAENIVTGATAFFSSFADRHPELEGEDLLNSFMDTIRGGINDGYEDAYNTLKGIGAFEFEGVQSGVEQTKILIEKKLKAFEAMKRKELGLTPVDESAQNVKSRTTAEVLSQGGVGTLSVTA